MYCILHLANVEYFYKGNRRRVMEEEEYSGLDDFTVKSCYENAENPEVSKKKVMFQFDFKDSSQLEQVHFTLQSIIRC